MGDRGAPSSTPPPSTSAPDAVAPVLHADGLTAQTLRDLLDGAPDAIVVIDDSGLIRFASSACYRTFGYTSVELIGQSIEILVPETSREAHAAHRSRYRSEPRVRPMGAGLELMGRRRDGSEFPIEISLSPVTGATGPLVMAAVRDITERRAAREANIASRERERIAHDLHDLVIQRLFGAGMSLQVAVGMATSEDLADRMLRVVDELDNTIREIREVIFGLQSPADRGGSLHSRLQRIVAECTDGLGFEPQLNLIGPIDSAVPAEVAEHMVAVLRESLSNCARHAKATAVTVTIEAGDTLSLRVVDDGVGVIDAPGAGSHRGRGLANMMSRALALGGAAKVCSEPLGGTLVEWRVPLRGR